MIDFLEKRVSNSDDSNKTKNMQKFFVLFLVPVLGKEILVSIAVKLPPGRLPLP